MCQIALETCLRCREVFQTRVSNRSDLTLFCAGCRAWLQAGASNGERRAVKAREALELALR